MIVSFTPVEGDTRTYDFKPKKMLSVEAETVERLTGRTYNEAVQAMIAGSALCRRAVVFVLEKRAHPTLSWGAFDFPYDAVEVEFDATELADIKAAVSAAPGLTEDERTAALEQIEALEGDTPEAPKAPEPTDATTT